MTNGLIVVGAGLAAATLITTLREAGDRRPITLIGDEPEFPYERPPLSKEVLLGKKEPDSAFVHGPEWYAGHEVETVLEDPATAVDVAERTVRLGSGRSAAYDDLVLATGAEPRRLDLPGAELLGIHTLRRIWDSLTLRDAFAPGVRVVVVGAGWIGLEVAAAAREHGAEVTVLECEEVPLQATMGARLGTYFADLHRRHGVEVRTGTRVTEFLGEEVVAGVRTGEGDVPADLVVLGVGAAPNTELADRAGLAVEDGVVVDEQLRAAEHVYAIGDVARGAHSTLGRLRVEHWDNAIRQGRMVAELLTGVERRFDWQPYFFTDQFDLGMEYVGLADPEDEVVIRGEESSGEFISFWLRDQRVTAAMNVNVWDVNDRLRELIGSRIDADRLADPGASLW